MMRTAVELVCLGSVVAGCYLAWPPAGLIVFGALGFLHLFLSGGRSNDPNRRSTR